MNHNLTITILAGGLGKRMKSTLPKVLHEVHGVPMLVKVIQESIKLNPTKILIVVGQYKPIIEQTLSKWNLLNNITFAIQQEPLGTGHAVQCTLNHLDNDGYNIILNGDSPLLSFGTIADIVQTFISTKSELQLTSIDSPNPTGSGRIIRDDQNNFLRIIEEKDCTTQQKQINEINIGIYIAKNTTLKQYIPMIQNKNSQQEYYLTDIVEIYNTQNGKRIGLIKLPSSKLNEVANVNTIDDLNKLNI